MTDSQKIQTGRQAQTDALQYCLAKIAESGEVEKVEVDHNALRVMSSIQAGRRGDVEMAHFYSSMFYETVRRWNSAVHGLAQSYTELQ